MSVHDISRSEALLLVEIGGQSACEFEASSLLSGLTSGVRDYWQPPTISEVDAQRSLLARVWLIGNREHAAGFLLAPSYVKVIKFQDKLTRRQLNLHRTISHGSRRDALFVLRHCL